VAGRARGQLQEARGVLVDVEVRIGGVAARLQLRERAGAAAILRALQAAA
jgi:hypothetical protein